MDDGCCHISWEVLGDPSNPMTTQRAAIFKPLGLELTRQMEAAMGRTREDASSTKASPNQARFHFACGAGRSDLALPVGVGALELGGLGPVS